MFCRLRLCLVFFTLICAPAHAIDLYSGEVAVTGQSAEERLESVPAALIQVLQKHSGQREIPLHPALDSALLAASRIMVSFYYRQHERVSPDGTASSELRLVVDFLPDAVNEIVRELGLPRWRAERKPVTIWIVVDDGTGRRLMPVEYSYAWDALSDVAAIRGLPIAFPDLDEEQKEALDLQLLWGGFTDDLPAAMNRDGLVIVAARREGPAWNVRWNFSGEDGMAGWRNRDLDLSFALVDGLHQLTDLVAAKDAIAPSAQGTWQTELRIGGIRGAGDYARCLNYLEGLSVVEEVNIIEAGNHAARFVLDLNAMPEYLERELERDSFLVTGFGEREYFLANNAALDSDEREAD